MIIISPAPLRSTLGNSVTADRYARIFRSLGWRVRILGTYDGETADVLVGLHAKKSAPAVLAFRKHRPDGTIVLVLTGTDLYRDIRTSALARKAMDAADTLVTLQPAGIQALPRGFGRKAVAVIQSAPVCVRPRARKKAPFTVTVLGHLRYEKDPMRAAYASRSIDATLEVRVIQAGQILDARYAALTRLEAQVNPRYHYCGNLGRRQALRLLARSDLLVQSSRLEGGANSICEAMACGTPVIASRISGNIGILGKSYPGLYPCGDTKALRLMLERAIQEKQFYEKLRRAVGNLKPLVEPARERAAWREILPARKRLRVKDGHGT